MIAATLMLFAESTAGDTVGGDPDASRTVYAMVIALLLIGVALVFLAVWLFKQTKVDRGLLAPLETMSDRKWRRLDPASQRRLLDEERPEDAEPRDLAPIQPSVDADFEAGTSKVEGFEDLADDGKGLDSEAVPLDDTTAMDQPEESSDEANIEDVVDPTDTGDSVNEEVGDSGDGDVEGSVDGDAEGSVDGDAEGSVDEEVGGSGDSEIDAPDEASDAVDPTATASDDDATPPAGSDSLELSDEDATPPAGSESVEVSDDDTRVE